MATARFIIRGALRKLGVVGGVGRRNPSQTEYQDALAILASLYRALITGGTFGRLRDVVPMGDYVAGENQRIFRRVNDQQSIELPDTVSLCGNHGYCGSTVIYDPLTPIVPSTDYGARPYGVWSPSERRTIRDNSVVTIVDEFSGDMLEAIYDGQTKRWFILSDLDYIDEEVDGSNQWSVERLNDALDQPAPLSHRDTNGLICLLATMLADDFDAEVSQTTALLATQFRQALVCNYSTYKADDDMPALIVAPAVGGNDGGSNPAPVPLPVQPENLLQVTRSGTTPVSVSNTSESDLVFIVPQVFSLNSVDQVLYFTATQALQLGNLRHPWVLKDISSDQVLETGFIEATGVAV